MKNKLWILLKNNIINSFKLKALTKKKLVLFVFLGIYIFSSCIFTLTMFLNTFFDTLKTNNLTTFFIPVLFSIASMFAFVFTIFSAKAWLFDNKDNDLLLSLPIKRKTILLNRLLYLSLLNFVIGLIIIIPGLFIYISNVNVNLIFCISTILMTIFFPIIPTVLASCFGYLIAFITSKVKRKNTVELLSYIIFIAAYMYLFSNANNILLKLVGNPELLNNILRTLFLPIYLIGKSISTNNLIYIIYFIATNLVIIFLFIFLLNKSYFKIISNLNSHQTKSNFKMHSLSIKTQMRALKEKELKRYFSSAIYVFNTLFGMLLIVIVSVGSIFYSSDKIIDMIQADMPLDSFKLVFCLFIFSIALTNTTSSSISIERNNLWILKMIPIKVKDIFNAKIFVNRIVVIPVGIISLILFKISNYINFTEMLLMIVLTILFNYFISNFGLISNLLFPRLDAINDTVIVKQSTSSLVGILVPFFAALAMIATVLSINISNNIILLISILTSLVLYIITNIIINNWGIKKFNKIN